MRNWIGKIVCVSALLLATSSASWAADVRMGVDHELISLMDRAVLKIEFIDTKGDPVDIPPVDGLEIQYQGQSSETRIVNMVSSSKVVHTYLVTPSKVGDYTIGPITVKFKGGEKELSAKLRVIKPQDDPEAQQLSQRAACRKAGWTATWTGRSPSTRAKSATAPSSPSTRCAPRPRP